MLYQNYQSKLSGYMKFFEGVWRFRFVILGGIVLLLALIFTMLGITGHIYRESCPASTEYGTPIAFEAEALFCETRAEYRKAGGSAWTAEQPVATGAYEVRAVSRSGFGTVSYGQTFAFSILPRTTALSVVEDSIVYGEALTATADLAYGDILAESEIVVEKTADFYWTATAAEPKIVNERGEDVTFCYEIIPADKQVAVMQREIALRTEGAVKVYDGTPLAVREYHLTDGTLAEGDTLAVSFSVSLTQTGAIENIPDISIRDAEGKDVTKFYRIGLEPGVLKVEPRALNVIGMDAEKIYDGIPLELDLFHIDENTSLLEGHRAEYAGDMTNVGDRAISELIRIVDRNGEDVTKNYSIASQAHFRIFPRPITVETSSKTWIYDGEPHAAAGEGDLFLTSDSAYPLVRGHSLQVDPVTVSQATLTEITDTATEVVYRDNTIGCLITDGDGTDVTKNYSVEYRYGRLRIKSEVIITLYAIEKMYDGAPLFFEEGDWTIVGPPDVSTTLAIALRQTEAGEVTLAAVKDSAFVEIRDKETGADVASENRVRWEGETDTPFLIVLPREITIASISIGAEHDRTEVNGWGHEEDYRISFGSLANGHRLTVRITGVLLPNVSETENTIEEYHIYDARGKDVTKNYSVTLSPGILEWI